jgi:hypothetical protein
VNATRKEGIMALVRWTPGTELETLRHEMERLFERTFPKMFGYEMEAEREWRPIKKAKQVRWEEAL